MFHIFHIALLGKLLSLFGNLLHECVEMRLEFALRYIACQHELECPVGGLGRLRLLYLLHLLRSFKANPQFAVMVSGVKIARLAELAGMAVAVRARAYAYAAAEAEKLRFADAQVLARKRKKGKAVRK